MEIFGIGILELIFIAVIMLIVLGPGQLEKTLRTLGRWIAEFRRSKLYQDLTQTEKLKRTIMQETGLEQVEEELNNFRNWQQHITDLDQSIGGPPPRPAPALPPSSPETPAAPAKSTIPPAPQYKGWVTPIQRPSPELAQPMPEPTAADTPPTSGAGFAGWVETTAGESAQPPAA